MKNIIRNSLLILMLICAVDVNANSIVNDIITGLTSGNASLIEKRLDPSAEFVIVDACCQGQSATAKALNTFFSRHKPKGFKVMHQGNNDQSLFVIGNLTTEEGLFRVYFLVKGNLIQQLRIERNDD